MYAIPTASLPGGDHLRLELERKIYALMHEYQHLENKMQTLNAHANADKLSETFAPAKVFPRSFTDLAPSFVAPPPGLGDKKASNRAGSYASSTTSATSHVTVGDHLRGSPTREDQGASSEEDYASSEPVTVASSAQGARGHKDLNKEELQALQNVALAGGGLSGCTTVMIRELPAGCSQKRLLREIDNADFAGQYDFFYMPVDPRARSNRGFAFVNFINPEIAERFYHKLDGQIVAQIGCSDVALRLVPADVQGFDANFAQFNAASKKAKRRLPHSKPIFLRQTQCAPGPDSAVITPTSAMSKFHASQALPLNQSQARRGDSAAAAAPVVFCTGCGASRTDWRFLFCESCGARFPDAALNH